MIVFLRDITGLEYKIETEHETLEELETYISNCRMFFSFRTQQGTECSIATDKILRLTVIEDSPDDNDGW